MKKLILAVCMLACAPCLAKVPQAKISNGLVEATLYLPDARNGYYRATRFDWAGVIPQLKYAGHEYFGQWFPTYDPYINDAICGPVESFAPIGFSEAGVGENFLMIGIGGLRRPDEKRHDGFRLYEITVPGKWKVKKSRDEVSFTHTLTDAAGYSYEYTKTVHLVAGKPELRLEHTLKNTGNKKIETTVYNHNFFTIDNQPTSPDVVVKFPYQVTGRWEPRPSGYEAKIEGNAIIYPRPFGKDDTVYLGNFAGFGSSAEDYGFSIENLRTGAGVRATGDRPVLKMGYWACATTSCPEPFIEVKVAPGETFAWTINYEFYTIEASK